MPGLTPAVKAILALTVAVSILQALLDAMSNGAFTAIFGLSLPGLRHGFFWQPLTYALLHGGIMHLLLNMLGLYFFGTQLERHLGTRRFVGLYIAGAAIGGIGWILISASGSAPCIGASGAVYATLGAFAALFPRQPVTLLVLFVFPVTMSARTLAIMLAAIASYSLWRQDGNIAHAAHLAGGIAGYLYGRRLGRGGEVWISDPHPGGSLFRRIFRPRQRSTLRVVRPWEEELPTEERVDAILEKLSRHGMASLTADERDILDRASRVYKHR